MTTQQLIAELKDRVRLHEMDEQTNREEGRPETAKMYATRIALMRLLIRDLKSE